MIVMHITTTDSSEAHIAQRKKLRRRCEGDPSTSTQNTEDAHDEENGEFRLLHVKQMVDLLSWSVGAMNGR
jgi:hypothetical protein